MILRSRKTIIIVISTLFLLMGSTFLFPQVRLYVAAWAGSSDAMYKIADEYYADYGGLFRNNPGKGDYWRRRAVSKGNLVAYHHMIDRWGISNPHEVVYWLKHGCDLGIPWCAEELARAYYSGRFALGQELVKSREYDDLAVELHRKKGTLKDHACQFLPPAPPWVYPWDLPPPLTPEIHPGIPRESVSKK